MASRVTLQIVEVLTGVPTSGTTPVVRVTQHVVEVVTALPPPVPLGTTQPHVQVIS